MFKRLTFADIYRQELLREMNDCHTPAGSPGGGQFCSKGGGASWTPGPSAGVTAGPDFDMTPSTPNSPLARARVAAAAGGTVGGVSTAELASLIKRSFDDVSDEQAAQTARGIAQRVKTPEYKQAVTQAIKQYGPSAGVTKAPKSRLSIKASTYRDKPGFSIYGKVDGRSVRVFTKTRDSAERIKKRLAAGQHTRVEDFE